jgi:RNA polymerase sigma factor (TIGR02999 family)
MEASPEEVTRLMQSLCQGNREAAGQLIALFYPDLRRLAQSQMRRERSGHTWQPTVLVNELYLELLKIRRLGVASDRALDDRQAFFGLAAFLMKRMLIHHARPLARRVDKVELAGEVCEGRPSADDLAHVEHLLTRLEEIDPQLRTILELRVFEGCSVQEIANALDMPPRTVDRRWAFTRKWLSDQMEV